MLQGDFGGKGLPSESSITRWLREWGVCRKRWRPRHKGSLIERSKLTIPKAPNDVWTVDFKGWFRTSKGVRMEPLTVRDLKSIYILDIVLQTSQSVEQTHPSFARIFRKYGLPQIIRSDNGCPSGATGAQGLTRLSAWWIKLGIKVEFTAPGHPEQNGSHEQFHRIYEAEVLQVPAQSLRTVKRRTEAWCKDYNTRRPHEALGNAKPAQIYRKSSRKMPKTLEPWHYPKEIESRRVKGKRMISMKGRLRYIGEAFEGERIGLKTTRQNVWNVYFGSLFLGELLKDKEDGIHARWYQKKRRRISKKPFDYQTKV